MKNKFTGAACLFLLLLLAACSKERDIRTAIPSDVKMVVATDFKALVKKGGLTDPKMAQSVKKLIEENVPEEDRAFAGELLDDPAGMGIDFDQPVYTFRTAKDEIAVVAKLADKSDFKEFFSRIWRGETEVAWKSEDGFDYDVQGDGVVIMNDELAMIMMASSGSATSDALRLRSMGWINQRPEDSFQATEDCEKMDEEQGDISSWMSMEIVPEEIKKMVPQMGLPRDVQLDDIHYLVNLDFEEGKVVLHSEVLIANEAAAKHYEEQAKILKPLDGKFFPTGNASPWIWAGVGIDGPKLYQQLRENAPVKQLLEGAVFGFNIQKLISSMDGDVAVSADIIPDSSAGIFPLFTVQAELDNDSILEDMDVMQQTLNMLGLNMKKDSPRQYSLEQQKMKLWLGVDKENHFYCTSDANVLQPDGKAADWAADAEGCLFYMRMDIHRSVEKQSSMLKSDPRLRVSMPIIELFDAVTLYAKDANECRMELTAVDKDANLLQQILAKVVSLYGTH